MVLTILAQNSDLYNDIRYNKGGKWDDPKYIQAVKDFKKLFDEGVFQNMTDVGYGRALQLFDTGKAAVVFQETWEAEDFTSRLERK